jgi:hypothetical protein
MGRGKKHTAEQIVSLLRQVEVEVANGKTLALACKESEIVEQTYYRWRKEFDADFPSSLNFSLAVRRRTIHCTRARPSTGV